MGKAMAAAGILAHFVLQPGVVAGRTVGVAVLAAGAAVLVQAFVRFVAEGLGSPAPIVPTQRLVVDGPYRYVRNPMYLAVVAIIVGQALLLGQPGLVGYATVVGGATAAFAHGYEEPTLRRQFGAQYEAYRRAVPAWWPRPHPWQPGQPDQPADTRGDRRHG